jgi:addiction module HigA family antidote
MVVSRSMLMAKRITPGDVVNEKLTEFHLSIRELAKRLKLSETMVRQLIGGKTKISLHIAFRLAKFFGGSAEEWYKIQTEYEAFLLKKDAEFQDVLKSIVKGKKPTAAEIARAEKGNKPAAPKPVKAKKPRKAGKEDVSLDASPRKVRGRPPKVKTGEDASLPGQEKVQKKRGRPRKADAATPDSSKKVVVVRKRQGKKNRVGESMEVAEPIKKKPNSILIKKSKPKEHPHSEMKDDSAPLFSEDLNIPVEEAIDPALSLLSSDKEPDNQN